MDLMKTGDYGHIEPFARRWKPAQNSRLKGQPAKLHRKPLPPEEVERWREGRNHQVVAPEFRIHLQGNSGMLTHEQPEMRLHLPQKIGTNPTDILVQEHIRPIVLNLARENLVKPRRLLGMNHRLTRSEQTAQ